MVECGKEYLVPLKLTGAQHELFDGNASVNLVLPAQREGTGSSLPSRSVIPPAAPWTTLDVDTSTTGYLSVYLSEDLSRLPIRAITRRNDNKSDPNIETGTYGLFSTCERAMRAGIVKNRIQYIIFLSRRGNERVVSGYYRLRWKTQGVWHSTKLDYALAADSIHFVDPPIQLSNLPEPMKSAASIRFRLSKRLNAVETDTIIEVLDSRPSALNDYLSEIDRIEKFQAFHSGYRYVSWRQKDPFSWDLARQYLIESGTQEMGQNQSPTGFWRCSDPNCSNFVSNLSLLRRCPFCKAMGTLQVVANHRVSLGGEINETTNIHKL